MRKCSICGKSKGAKFGKYRTYCNDCLNAKRKTAVGDRTFASYYIEKNPDAVFGYICAQKKRWSKEHGLEYDLDSDFLKDMYEKQDGKCALTGWPLGARFNGPADPFVASLDRINSDVGYVKSNVRFVCYQVNLAKAWWTDEQLISLAHSIVNYKGKRRKCGT